MGVLASIISWIFFGLIAGAIARLLVPGRQPMGCLMTMALGIVGSFVGGGLSYLFFDAGESWIRPSGWIMSIIGAIIVLLLYGWAQRPRTAA